MPILSYQQLVNGLTQSDIRGADPLIVSQLMALFAKEKEKLFEMHESRYPGERYVINNLALYATLPTLISAEYFLSGLTMPEKRAIQQIAKILSPHMARLERYPKLLSLLAVGTATYDASYRSELLSAVEACGEVAIGKKEIVEEYNMQFEGIPKEKILTTIQQKGNDIDLIFTGTLYPNISRKESGKIREHYLQHAIPLLLDQNNIAYSHEERRMNGSSYWIHSERGMIQHTKHLDPYKDKQNTLIIQFPDCRPIHLDASVDTHLQRYQMEKHTPRSFSVLFHSLVDYQKFNGLIEQSIVEEMPIPEELSLAEKIKHVQQHKHHIDRNEVNKNTERLRQEKEEIQHGPPTF